MNVMRAGLAAWACLVISSVCYGQSSKIAPDLDGLDPQTPLNVIIQFSPGTDNEQQGIVSAAGGTVQADLPVIAGKVITIPAAALMGLAKNHKIVYISPDRPVAA